MQTSLPQTLPSLNLIWQSSLLFVFSSFLPSAMTVSPVPHQSRAASDGTHCTPRFFLLPFQAWTHQMLSPSSQRPPSISCSLRMSAVFLFLCPNLCSTSLARIISPHRSLFLATISSVMPAALLSLLQPGCGLRCSSPLLSRAWCLLLTLTC